MGLAGLDVLDPVSLCSLAHGVAPILRTILRSSSWSQFPANWRKKLLDSASMLNQNQHTGKNREFLDPSN
jgi:hypothetical protein